jgi:hypothetical protein
VNAVTDLPAQAFGKGTFEVDLYERQRGSFQRRASTGVRHHGGVCAKKGTENFRKVYET